MLKKATDVVATKPILNRRDHEFAILQDEIVKICEWGKECQIQVKKAKQLKERYEAYIKKTSENNVFFSLYESIQGCSYDGLSDNALRISQINAAPGTQEEKEEEIRKSTYEIQLTSSDVGQSQMSVFSFQPQQKVPLDEQVRNFINQCEGSLLMISIRDTYKDALEKAISNASADEATTKATFNQMQDVMSK